MWVLLLLLLGVRSLHDQGSSGDEWHCLLQLLLAAVEFGRQGSADRPRVFSCGFVKGHLCRTCSAVCSSWPHGQVGEGASFSLRCIWLFRCFAGSRCVCVVHWHCTAQLSMFNMEKRFRNKIIIIIIIIQSVMTGAKPHQNDLLLPGQQVVVIPL